MKYKGLSLIVALVVTLSLISIVKPTDLYTAESQIVNINNEV